MLARALRTDGGGALLDDAAALALANRLEGHPDNVAPALLGGFVICGQAGELVWAQNAPVDPSISAVVLVPPYGVATEVARGLLPDVVPHAEAAANTGRAALLVAALGGEPHMLLRATEDFLHQRQREPAMPESIALVADLRARGVPAVVSGAGPTVLAFVADGATPGADLVVGLAPSRVADMAAGCRGSRSPRGNLSAASRPASRLSTIRSRRHQTPSRSPPTGKSRHVSVRISQQGSVARIKCS